jgi:hypothetical protein
MLVDKVMAESKMVHNMNHLLIHVVVMSEVQKFIKKKIVQQAINKESEQVRFSISLDSITNTRLEALAQNLGLSKSAFCAELIASALIDAESVLNLTDYDDIEKIELEIPEDDLDEGDDLEIPEDDLDDAIELEIPEEDLDEDDNLEMLETPEDDDSLITIRPQKLLRTNRLTKKPKTNLRVTMPNGNVIMNPTAAQTFAEVIAGFGVEKVKALGLRRCRFDLVSTQKHKEYQQYPIGRYLVMTKTSTIDKKKTLEEIANLLGTNIEIEII